MSFPALLTLMFLGSLFDAPGSAFRQALLPELAERDATALARVNSATQTIYALTALLGPPFAGVLIARFGASNVLWLDAASFVISAALILAAVPHVAVAAKAGTSYGQEIRAGFRFLWHHRLLRTIALMALVTNFLISPIFTVALPVYADRVFGSARDLGLMTSGFGLGALLGAVLYGLVGPRLPGRALFLTTVVLLALPLLALATLPGLWPAFGLLAVTGLGAGMINPFVGTIFQERTPAGLRRNDPGVRHAGHAGRHPDRRRPDRDPRHPAADPDSGYDLLSDGRHPLLHPRPARSGPSAGTPESLAGSVTRGSHPGRAADRHPWNMHGTSFVLAVARRHGFGVSAGPRQCHPDTSAIEL